MRSVDPLPDLLTVEEAAAVLRISRGKAYELAREWRATGGEAGMPVLDFGNVLRVPRHALEAMVGGPLTSPAGDRGPIPAPGRGAGRAEPRPAQTKPARSRSRRRFRNADQLALFDPTPRS